MTMSMGTHLLVNLHGCPKNVLEHADIVLKLLNQIIDEAQLNKIGESSYQFDPTGATCVILLAESHISIHTWPEHNSAAVDIYTCADAEKNQKAYETLIKLFKPERVEKQQVAR